MGEYVSLENLGSVSYPMRSEFREGRKYIVVPVVALVEGVHNGLYYSPESLERSVPGWNGVPLSINHPQIGSQSVSANSPDVRENQTVGWFYNVVFEDGKLKGEAWIDEEKCQRLAPEILDYVNSGRPLEVSTGLWSDAAPESGTWGDEEFSGSIITMIPDHLALLPGGEGACNFDDGCGIRANKGEDKMGDEFETLSLDFVINPYPNEHACRLRNPGDFQDGSFRRMKRRHNGKEYSVIMGRLSGETTMTEQAYRYPKTNWTVAQARSHCRSHDGRFEAAIANKESGSMEEAMGHINSVLDVEPKALRELRLIIQEMSQTQMHNEIRRMLDAMDTTQPRRKLHYLVEVFDEHFIFKIDEEGQEDTLWKQSYTFNEENDEVEFTGDPAPVRKQVDYIELNKNQNERSEEEMAKETKTDQPCCPDRVKALIANEKSKWTDSDEEFLNGLSEELLEKLEPDMEDEAPAEESTTDESAEEESTQESAEEDEDKEPVTMEKYLEDAPEDIREMLQEGVAMQKNRKAKLIKSLLACERNVISEADLKDKSVKELEALSKLAALPTFEANAPKQPDEELETNEEDGGDAPSMPLVDWGKAANK